MPGYTNPIPQVDDPTLQDDMQTEIEPIVNDYTPKESVFFAFIDVLGFKKVFDDNRLKGEDNFADKFRDVFTYYFDLMNSANFKNFCYAGQTSDSLYFYTQREDFLIEFLKIFSHLNIYAMTKDVFFRGGIAKGNLFCKEKYQFYGESVIYAYLLESEISKYPIIVIDENTYEAISKYPDDKDKLISTRQGRYYIKPFAYLEEEFALDVDQLIEKEIKKEIDEDLLYTVLSQNKSKFEYDARNYDKYVFLLNEYKQEPCNRIGGIEQC